MKKNGALVFIFLLINCFSCNFMGDPTDLKRLDEKIIFDSIIEVRWYETSSVTNSLEHVSVVKDDSEKEIARLNSGGIDSIYIRKDSIFLMIWGTGPFYSLDDRIYDYSIVLDTIR